MKLNRVFRELGLALSLILFISVIATSAQDLKSQESKAQESKAPELKAKDPGTNNQEIKQSKETTEQAETAQEPAPVLVLPPAPSIVKKNPNIISIPLEHIDLSAYDGQAQKYEQRPATSTPKIGSLYGYRRDPFTRRAKFHSGVDLKARRGDLVAASYAGVVQFAGWYYGYGNLLIVNHGGGVTTYYAHLSSFDLKVGEKVERGTIVGRAGSTGRATSPHLHYELRIDGNPVNPFQAIALDPSSGFFKEAEAVDTTRPRRVEAEEKTEKRN